MKLNINSNPSLLDLLAMGAIVILPDTRFLEGETDGGYINFGYTEPDGNRISAGRYNLSREGLRNTLSDRDFMALASEASQ